MPLGAAGDQRLELLVLDDFDVDRFVSDCRKRVQLEELREDLELYYRLLKTAMVELINQDYADFVNLSTNLVGVDKALSQLSVPLGQLREEVLSLRASVSEGIRAVDERISKQEDIREKKMCVLRLIQVIRSVEKIEKILNSQSSKETSALEVHSALATGQVLERVAAEFNQLQFHAVQSKGLPLLDRVRPRVAGITAMLQRSLEGLLLEGLRASDVDVVRHCLRTYATIDKTRDAEALVGQVLVKPYLDQVIVEQVVESRPDGLQLMYGKLLEFVPHHCRLLREVTGGAISSEKGNTVPGYDFLVNSVWPEIVRALEEHLPSLFNPGNPDAFHEKYTVSMDFVRAFERQCGSQASVKRLRAHPAYLGFHSKWNLPVYFQIRFREIAGSLEAALTDALEDAPAGSSFCLLASHATWSSLQGCWSDTLFLPSLAHRLWRLTLQILARFSVFVHEVRLTGVKRALGRMRGLLEGHAVTRGCLGAAAGSLTCTSFPSRFPFTLVGVTSRGVHGSRSVLGHVGNPHTDMLNPESASSQDKSRALHLLPHSLSAEARTVIARTGAPRRGVLPEATGVAVHERVLERVAAEDSPCRALAACEPALSSRVVQDLSESCFSSLRSALDVPRLYRRTNKEVPTAASPYVDSALKPLHQLQSEHGGQLGQATLRRWLEDALSASTHRYYETVSDVLQSVRKVEESLKRLKQARKTAPAHAGGPGGGMSDDDKIRLQLALDVEHLGEQIRKMGLRTQDIKSFPALAELVAGAKDQTTAEQP
ncbi:conserved oligomeric Golgi complex subunit 2 [Pteropus alecto]|uniref:conserved oligomeric Golgi complex subunit 2 n=1 Tax=Pteropus alecto TaxID=9402 RepID=UPI000D53997E|nr:conserved oligomeric Golgi complex subunit 2 [Pteropus alecto]